MCSIISDKSSFADKRTGSCRAGISNAVRLFAATLTAATLVACAQSPVVTDDLSASRQPSLEPPSKASLVTSRRAAAASSTAPSVAKKDRAQTDAAYGLASYYRHASRTASGETFDPRELTAAHRTLPFGTRVRVTDLATGRSVTVRVNDRGPFVPGRIVDVSHSAAESLGIVGRGVAKVKLDVVE
jgi:rare lipoprotein A